MSTFKLTIEYDGTAYAGWQRQLDHPTVQGVIEEALFQLTQDTIPVLAAGRTDSGVHARGQVISFRSEKNWPAAEWKRALNGVLPGDICVRAAEQVSDAFHARYSARTKLYEYLILNRQERSALDRYRAWHVPKALDTRAMQRGAAFLVGRHDFSSFQGSPTDTPNSVCDVKKVDIHAEEGSIRIQVEADRFLKQMVRAMVGTLVEVGLGKRDADSLKGLLEARDRRAAGYTAPAHGLYLVSVEY